jgi:hypothetical protein
MSEQALFAFIQNHMATGGTAALYVIPPAEPELGGQPEQEGEPPNKRQRCPTVLWE